MLVEHPLFVLSFASAVGILLLLLLLLPELSFGFTVTTSSSSSSFRYCSCSSSSSGGDDDNILAPEINEEQKQNVRVMLNRIYGEDKSEESEERRSQARSSGSLDDIPQHELVYGELGLDALVTILDAVGVQRNDQFMDIGSGDGMLVSAASMLYPDYLKSSMGIEIVPDLHERSLQFQSRLKQQVMLADKNDETAAAAIQLCPTMSLDLGNIYEPSPRVQELLSNKTTLAVCFATTWSRGMPGKKLPRLSKTLGTNGPCELPSGARLVIIDGVLDHEKDGFDFGGQFQLYCPDTAPYSTARLYTKL